MAGYVDGFVMPLPKANVDNYREVATTAGGLWMSTGRTTTQECLADDVKMGEVTSFPVASSSRMTRRPSAGRPTSHGGFGTT